MSGEFTFDTKAFERALKEVPKALDKEANKALNRMGVEFTTAMDGRFNGTSSPPFWANESDDGIVSRTGHLARSIGFDVSGGPSAAERKLVLFIGDAVAGRYAATQEFGATITGSPWLTIPLPDNKTASGVPRYQSAAALRDDPSVNTWIQRSKAGNLIIRAQFDGEEEIKNLWVLKKSVTIPARLGFTKTFKGQRDNQIRLMNRAVIRALKTIGDS